MEIPSRFAGQIFLAEARDKRYQYKFVADADQESGYSCPNIARFNSVVTGSLPIQIRNRAG